MTLAKYLGVLAAVALIGGCGSPAGGGPRVFFAEPKDGATVKSPVHLAFGIRELRDRAGSIGHGRKRPAERRASPCRRGYRLPAARD